MLEYTGAIQLWGVSNEEYHEDYSAIGSSMLKDFRKSPARYYGLYVESDINKRIQKPEPSKEMKIGSALHCRVLEPERFPVEYIQGIKVDRRTKEGKADWTAFEAQAAGKTILDQDEMELVENMAKSLYADKLACSLLSLPGMTERALRWKDERTGLDFKVRLDKLLMPPNVRRPVVLDLKSSVDPSPEEFSKQAYNFSYHVQEALYTEAARLLLKTDVLFLFVVVGKEPPHDVAVCQLEPDYKQIGVDTLWESAETLAECYRKNQWQAEWQGKLSTLKAPRWVQRQARLRSML